MGLAKKVPAVALSEPLFLDQAHQLQKQICNLTIEEIQKLMHVSHALAAATKQRMEDWSADGKTPAWLSFQGDVYKGLRAETFDASDFNFAQKKAATLSGLYGILRPLDAVSPYRLELGYRLRTKCHNNLYEYWGKTIASSLPQILEETQPIINLASEEYMKAIMPYVTNDRIISPWFMQIKDGVPVFQAVHAKNARGSFMHWIVKNRITSTSDFQAFAEDRYEFDSELSTTQKPVFTRLFIPVAQQSRVSKSDGATPKQHQPERKYPS